MRGLDSIISAVNMNLGKLWDMARDSEARHAIVCEVEKSRTRLSD